MWHFLFLRKGVTGHMEKLVKVAVDAMGGDHAPGEVVKGAVDAVNEKNNLKVFLVGKAPRIHEELSKYQYKNEQIEVVNAEEEISCDESPVEAIRKKKDSSMVVALKMVKDKTADAFVSAGSSGAILVGGQFVVGRIKGIKRAPLGAVDANSQRSDVISRCWSEYGCESGISASVCTDGIYLYGRCSWNQEPKSWTCQCRCGRSQRKSVGKRNRSIIKGM